ncbi:MAG: type II toxin-antitoxin system Phd/YefM family antitoxin [Proteobacteria bacterium]|nr:type II toxin-antitoxin system Phd/YefM family antitoxin [Pseudomonadota bacterium]MBU1584812.1 type II toxin-antitoxin system Phd/YefM family antitoxin [Pseudomonadota bacterium]MBU2452114.1 type II toxin-antitoxin system Phd/YefM family antitoxin [Pseudomonadota bacterium]MBU2629535.1 type II toxin-antitoxin system Phd/YefM family antitoxin [Pseudomonadota bacterium]
MKRTTQGHERDNGKEPVILTRRGQDVAALVSIEELELLQKIEDHIDLV